MQKCSYKQQKQPDNFDEIVHMCIYKSVVINIFDRVM